MDVNDFKIRALPVKNKLFRIAKRLLNNTEDAEDAVQEVFMKLWQRKDELDAYTSLEALAVTITKNHCIDKLRVKKMQFSEINEDVFLHSMETPEKDFVRNEAFNQIAKIISMLPENQKIALHLRDIEGYPIEEIAGILETSAGNVRVILSRARNQVKNILLKTNRLNYEVN
jgi:RNA polymerase sigma factor (sigma-70 family)